MSYSSLHFFLHRCWCCTLMSKIIFICFCVCNAFPGFCLVFIIHVSSEQYVYVSEAISHALRVVQAIVVIVRIHSIRQHCLRTIQGPLTTLSPLSTHVLPVVTSLSPVHRLLHKVPPSSPAPPFPPALSTLTLIVHLPSVRWTS